MDQSTLLAKMAFLCAGGTIQVTGAQRDAMLAAATAWRTAAGE